LYEDGPKKLDGKMDASSISCNDILHTVFNLFLCVESCSVWMERVWVPVLGYLPEVIFLTKGWIGIICETPEDAELLLSRKWVNGNSSLMLKKWRLAFNPETKYFSLRHIWVMLPGLPLYLWNEGALTAIRNNLGSFIMVDKKNLEASNRKVAKVLVEMDVHLGLSDYGG
jgi:hypothetical protein